VPVHVVWQEHGEKASLNNPGGAELAEKLGGKTAGLPFFAFLDEHGEMIVNSNRPDEGKPPAPREGVRAVPRRAVVNPAAAGNNIGYPAQPEEIQWFMAMLQKAAPQMTADESGTLEAWLKAHSK